MNNYEIETLDEKLTCNQKAEWEVGFSGIIECSSMAFLAGDEMEFHRKVCNKHFLFCDSAGNTICFRKLGDSQWLQWNGAEFDRLFETVWYKVERNEKLAYFLQRD